VIPGRIPPGIDQGLRYRMEWLTKRALDAEKAIAGIAACAHTTDATALPLASGADTRWNFDAVTYDPHGLVSNNGPGSTSWGATVPVAGVYHVTAVVSCVSAATCDVAAGIVLNGVIAWQAVTRYVTGGLGYVAIPLSADLHCAAGDEIHVALYQNSGGPLTGEASPAHNQFAIHWVGGA
jgi:hypothetical protein